MVRIKFLSIKFTQWISCKLNKNATNGSVERVERVFWENKYKKRFFSLLIESYDIVK